MFNELTIGHNEYVNFTMDDGEYDLNEDYINFEGGFLDCLIQSGDIGMIEAEFTSLLQYVVKTWTNLESWPEVVTEFNSVVDQCNFFTYRMTVLISKAMEDCAVESPITWMELQPTYLIQDNLVAESFVDPLSNCNDGAGYGYCVCDRAQGLEFTNLRLYMSHWNICPTTDKFFGPDKTHKLHVVFQYCNQTETRDFDTAGYVDLPYCEGIGERVDIQVYEYLEGDFGNKTLMTPNAGSKTFLDVSCAGLLDNGISGLLNFIHYSDYQYGQQETFYFDFSLSSWTNRNQGNNPKLPCESGIDFVHQDNTLL